jgi:hypothetical protein
MLTSDNKWWRECAMRADLTTALQLAGTGKPSASANEPASGWPAPSQRLGTTAQERRAQR